jgi:hypothetical protein
MTAEDCILNLHWVIDDTWQQVVLDICVSMPLLHFLRFLNARYAFTQLFMYSLLLYACALGEEVVAVGSTHLCLPDWPVKCNSTFSRTARLRPLWKAGVTGQNVVISFPLLLCSLSVISTRRAIYRRITATERTETSSWRSVCLIFVRR